MPTPIKKMRRRAEGSQDRPDHVHSRGGRTDPGLGSGLSAEPDRRGAAVRCATQIKAAPKDGMAMGLAMKALAGQPVESDDVKAAIAAIRAS